MRSGTGISRSGTHGRVALVALLALALPLLVAPGAAPTQPAAASSATSSTLRRPPPASRSGFSRAQMRRAKPLAAAASSTPPARRAATPAAERRPASPTSSRARCPPAPPSPTPRARAGASARGFGKFTSNAVADPTVFPNTTNGKVIGKIPGVGLYTCSASVVHAKNRNTIFTAGHCVKDPDGRFASKLAFAPAYTDGSRRSASGRHRGSFVQKAWAKGNINYDYAAVALKPSEGRKVEKVAGSKGFAYDIPVKKKNFRAVGYPFNKDRTETMWECRSGFGGYDPGYRRPGPSPFGIGCDMKEGASGGGWTVPGEYLASVTSFTYDQLPNHLFGPQLHEGRRQAPQGAPAASRSAERELTLRWPHSADTLPPCRGCGKCARRQGHTYLNN